MAVKCHRVDPDPDLVIALRNPCRDFAPWGDPLVVHNTSLETARDDDWGSFVSMKMKKKNKKKKGSFLDEERSTIEFRGSLFGPEHAHVANSPSKFTNLTSLSNNASDSVEAEKGEEENPSILYYVSSRNLITASPWFRQALRNGEWKESVRDEDGLLHMTAEDWDSDAFLILMNIFHLKNRMVPQRLSLDEVAKIAVLVDYYDCAEAVELFTNIWKYQLAMHSMPSVYNRSLVLWVWISWVFKWPDLFRDATLVTINHCSEPMRTLGLPIPERVSGQIDLKRYGILEQLIAGLHDLREKFLDLDYVCPHLKKCSFSCGSFLYGALSKEMLGIRLISPRPEQPFEGMSVVQLSTKIGNFKNVYYTDSGYSSSAHNYSSSCSLLNIAKNMTDNVTRTISGLQLDLLEVTT